MFGPSAGLESYSTEPLDAIKAQLLLHTLTNTLLLAQLISSSK